MTTLAYPHTLVAGQPENVNDLNDNLNAITTLVNGNLDATNLATSAKPVTLMGAYRTIDAASFRFSSINSAQTYVPDGQGGAIPLGGSSGVALVVTPFTLADYSISGLTTRFRVQAATITNTIAPAINFTFAVQKIATLGGSGGNITIATLDAPPPSVTRTAPAASSAFVDVTSDFALSTDGVYVLIVALSGSPAANSATCCRLRFQVHHI